MAANDTHDIDISYIYIIYIRHHIYILHIIYCILNEIWVFTLILIL